MKKILFLAILVVFQASIAVADEVEQGLMGSASNQIKSSARQVIRAGADSGSVIDVTRVMLQNDFKSEQILRAHDDNDKNAPRRAPPAADREQTFRGHCQTCSAGHHFKRDGCGSVAI